MKKPAIIFTVFFVFTLIQTSHCLSKEMQVIAGAGPSTAVVQLFIEKFGKLPAAANYKFNIPPKSAKHAGGIKNSDKFIFGRTGRPLNDKEKALGKEQIFLARVPIAFAVGAKPGITKLSLAQLETIFSKESVNWKDFGGADGEIFKIGREAGEALFLSLKNDFPFMENAFFNTIVKKDNQVIDLLKKAKGESAIGFGAKPNFEKASISTIEIDDFASGVSLGLVYDKKNSGHALIEATQAFIKSDVWLNALTSKGLLAP